MNIDLQFMQTPYNFLRKYPIYIATILIAIGFSISYQHAAKHHFLPCEYECGETLLAEFDARNVRLFGFKFGLLEDLATSPSVAAHPQYYTHNVNIGGLSFVLMEIAGIKDFSSKQTLIMLVWAFGLLYAYLCITHFSNSKLCGLFAIIFLISDFSFSHAYTTHALRTWQWLPIFALPYHISRFMRNQSRLEVVAILALICIAFGVGYDFWITLIFCSLFIMLFSYTMHQQISLRDFIKKITIFSLLACIPFFLRQLHVIFVMGYDYWIVDFYNTIGIKIPYFSRFITVPEVGTLDAWYKKFNVMRPPAAPINTDTFNAIVQMAQNSILNVIIPSAGIITVFATLMATTIGLVILIISLAIKLLKTKSSLLTSMSSNFNILGVCAYTCSMVLGYCCGFMITPSVSILYLLVAAPLLVAPLFATKSMLATLCASLLGTAVQKHNSKIIALACLPLIFLLADHIVLQSDNIRSLKSMDTSWLPVVQSMPDATFAVPYIQQSTSAFTNNWSIHVKGPGIHYEYFDLIQNGKPPFTSADLNFFGEKDGSLNLKKYTKPDYFLYYSTDQRINMFDPEPECRRDYILSFLRKSLRHKPADNIIQNISFISGIANNKTSVYVSGSINAPFEMIDNLQIKFGNDPAQPLVYNCFKSSLQGVYEVSQFTDTTIPYEIFVNKNGNSLLVFQDQVELKSEPNNTLTPPRTRQPSVKDVLNKYKDLKIIASRASELDYEGFLLIDLRELYKHQVEQ